MTEPIPSAPPPPGSHGARRKPWGVLAGVAVLASVAVACGGFQDRSTTAGPAAGPAATSGATTIDPTPTTVAPTTTTTIPTTTTTVDPGTLPQTDEKPEAGGARFDAWSRGLWQAIVADDPDVARPFFFPLTAYRQVKDISNPDRDYQNRLIAFYEDDIHKLHAQLGPAASTAEFVGIEAGPAPAWIKAGVEYNKGAYWRVFDSKLVYTVAGQRRTLPVKSMISWRGQWYVVHLGPIR